MTRAQQRALAGVTFAPIPEPEQRAGRCAQCHQEYERLPLLVRQTTRNPVITSVDWRVCSETCAEGWRERVRRTRGSVKE